MHLNLPNCSLLFATASFFLLASPQAIASGGDIELEMIECKGKGAALVTLSLALGTASEMRGHASVYADERDRSRMVTSAEDCFAVSEVRVFPQLPDFLQTPPDPSTEELALVCGTAKWVKAQPGVDQIPTLHLNSKGYRILFWGRRGSLMASVQKFAGPPSANVAQNHMQALRPYGDLKCRSSGAK